MPLSRRLFVLSGTQHRISSACHPQTNGLDERMNQTITKQLKYINAQENNWDKHLEEFLFSCWTSVHASTQYTPLHLMFRRESTLPIQLREKEASIRDENMTGKPDDNTAGPSDGDSTT